MAESVARVKVQATADLKGLDDAARALKGLQQAIAPTDAALSKARLEIIQFGYANKQTEKLIAAQVNALKSLRTEAQVGGQLYESLGRDISDLKNKLNGTSTATEKAASSFEQLGRAAANIQNNLQKQGQSFAAFKRQAGDTGKAVGELAAAFNIKFDRAGKAIEDAARQVEILKKNASNIGSLFQGPQKGGGLFEIPRKGLADIQAFSQLVKRLKEQSESAYGKVARISEGLFAVGASGAVVGQVANAFGGVSGAIEAASAYAAKFSGTLAGMGAGIKSGIGLGPLKAGLNEISLLLNQPANGLANLSQSLGKVQQSLDLLNVPAEAFNNALAALGPTGAAAAGVVALALAKVSEEKRKFLRDFEKEATEGLQGITDETQRLINKLAQLSEAFRGAASMNELQALRAGGAARFNETPAGTDASRRAANTIASAEARIKAEAMAQAEVLEAARQRYRGTTESVDALSERLAYLQQAMKYVDQSTAEGKAEFAAFSNEANKVKGQIDQLSNSYRTVADAIRDAARAQGEYANQGTVANYMNRAAVRQQEELVAAAKAALSQPQVPLLPAVGQTSFSGTYKPGGLGGGARMGTGGALDAQGRPRGNVETPFIIGTENVGVGTAVYRGAERTEMEIAGAAAALERDMRTAAAAVNNADKQVEDLKRSFQELIQPIEKVAKSDFFSPNSINALKARREQIDRERSAVDMLGDDYQRLSRELAKVDKQLERTQPGGLRGKIGYIGQGIGAAASAGIFGGPEGAIGGLLGGGIGALAGGPAGFAAGSFIGSSAGAYAGMGRQQLGQFTTYAADISKLEIALKGVTKTQEEYQRALAASASVTRDFNVPQLEATKGMTQLSAAVIGAGGKVADAEVVFRNVTAAIKASGGTSEDVQGALTALGQIFSKGKVSAEELQGQLGERLPGAVTMFAKATGRTLPQLQKDLEQGVVGLADLMKFVVSEQGLGQFEQRASAVAKSSAEAGARLTTTWNDTKRAIGEALLPLGAQIQDSLAKALREATPALVSLAQGVGSLIKLLVDNAGVITKTITTVGQFALVFTGASLAIKGFGLAVGVASQGLALLGAAFGTTTAQAVVAQNRLIAFGGTLKTLASAVAAPLVITIAIVGAQLVIDYFNRIKAARDELVNVVSQATGAEWLKDIGGDALTRDRLTKAVDEVGKAYQEAADKANKLRKERDLLNEMAATSPSATIFSATRLQEVEAQLKLAEAQAKLLETRYKAGINRLPNAPKAAGPLQGLTDFSAAGGKGDKDKTSEKLAEVSQRREESLFNAREQYEERIAEIRRSAIEQAQQLERQFADERRNTERDIERIRRQIAATQADTAFTSRIQSGEDATLVESERGIDQIMRKAEEERIRIQEEYSDKELQRTRTIADFQKNVADQINKANEAYAKQIGKIQREYAINSAKVVEKGGDAAGKQLEQSARLSALYIQRGALNATIAGDTGSFVADPSRPNAGGFSVEQFANAGWGERLGKELAAIIAIDEQVQAIRGQIQQFRPPAAPVIAAPVATALPPGVQRIPVSQQFDMPGAGAVAAANAQRQQVQLEQVNTTALDELTKRFQAISSESTQQVRTLKEQSSLINLQITYLRSGYAPELANQLSQQQAIFDKQKEQAEAERASALARGVSVAEVNTLYENQLAVIERQNQETIALTNQIAEQKRLLETDPKVVISERLSELRSELDQLTGMGNLIVNMSQTIESSFSTAISSAVTNLVTGAQTIKQTLAEMFRSIGEAFIKMAADIIAKQLMIVALNSIAKIFGGAANGAASQPASLGDTLKGIASYGFATGGVMTNVGPLPLKRYAAGGVANSPQMAVYGERGPEAYVPLPDGRNIPVKMKQRSEALNRYRPIGPMGTVGEGSDGGPAGSAGSGAAGGAIDVRYSVERINNVEYVTAEQFRTGMQQAAAQGAQRGEQRALRSLQQSTAVRNRVGIR